MATILKIISVFICSFSILVVIAGLGFHIEPKSFPPPNETTPDSDYSTVLLPSDLPGPVHYYSKTVLGDDVPEIGSAVIRGRAKCKMYGIWMPARFKGYYIPGREFIRYMEITWYGYPILKSYDSYIGSESILQTEGIIAIDHSDEKIYQGQNLAMWAEAVLMPSVFITDPNIRWEAVNDTSARLIVPYEDQEEGLLVGFDAKNGLMTQMSAMRYRNLQDKNTRWCIEYSDWKTFHSIKIPTQLAISWEDGPCSYWTIEGVEYNVELIVEN